MRLRSLLILPLLGAAAAAAGCGGASGPALPAASHKGLVNELPGKIGYFEIRARTDGAGAGGGTGGSARRSSSRNSKAAENAIVVHFYGPDGTTDMTPAPTDVAVKLGSGDSAQAIPLAAQSQGGGFASAPGHYPTAFRGTLTARINGEPVDAAFVIR